MALQIGDRVVIDGFYAEVAFLGEDMDGLPAGKYAILHTHTKFSKGFERASNLPKILLNICHDPVAQSTCACI
jgi:hypothetical protein